MLLPLHDRNPAVFIRFQFVTCLIIAACVLTFLWESALPDTLEGKLAFYRLSFVPARLFGPADSSIQPDITAGLLSMVTAMFLHAGFWHLFGNMAFLWVFGDNVEDATGHVRFVIFYLACGILAWLAQASANPHEMAPIVGASGAISGVLGAYLVLHPQVRILVMTFFFITFRMRAVWLLGLWISYQVVLGLLEDGTSHVAWWAHIGGFAAGAALIPLFRRAGVALFDRNDFAPEPEAEVQESAANAAAPVPEPSPETRAEGHEMVRTSLGTYRNFNRQRTPVRAGTHAAIVLGIIGGLWLLGVLTVPLAVIITGFGVFLMIQQFPIEPAEGGSRDEERDEEDAIANAVANYDKAVSADDKVAETTAPPPAKRSEPPPPDTMVRRRLE